MDGICVNFVVQNSKFKRISKLKRVGPPRESDERVTDLSTTKEH
jgi:hypothetical protein